MERVTRLKKPPVVISVSGGKGGVGKTLIAVNTAIALVSLGKKVMILDADMGLSNVDVVLGMRALKNLAHVMRGECALQDIILTHSSGLHVLPGASGLTELSGQSMNYYAGLINAFDTIDQEIDFLIVDTSAGISPSVIPFLCAADELIVVVCDEPASLSDAYALIKVMNQQYGVDHFQIVTNCVKSMQEGSELFAKLTKVTDQFLQVSLHELGAVIEDTAVRKAIQAQQAVIEAYPGSRAAQVIYQMAKKITHFVTPQSKKGGTLRFFTELKVRQMYSKAV